MLEFLASVFLFFLNLYIVGFLVACVWVWYKLFREESE